MNVVSPAQYCFDGVTKDRPAREQTNDRGSENKWQWLSKRERGSFVNAPHYRLLEIFHIRTSWRPRPRVQEKLIVARARYRMEIPHHYYHTFSSLFEPTGTCPDQRVGSKRYERESCANGIARFALPSKHVRLGIERKRLNRSGHDYIPRMKQPSLTSRKNGYL